MKKIVPENNKIQKIEAFQCLTCNKIIGIGLCGDHRQETGHKDFNETRSKDEIH